MNNKNKLFKIIGKIMFVGSIMFVCLILLDNIFDLKKFINYDFNIKNINLISILIIILALILILIFTPGGIVILVNILYHFIDKNIKNKNKEHPKFELEYFRDYLNKLSPAYASFLMNLNVSLDKIIPAHILKLQLDGYIDYVGEHWIVTNKNQDSLVTSDKIILDIVNNNFTGLLEFNDYKVNIIRELEEQGYIKRVSAKAHFTKIFVVLFIVWILTNLILSLQNLINIYEPLILLLVLINFILPVLFIIGMPVYAFAYIKNHHEIKRTVKGNELLEKIYGLKNFLLDFTNIDDSRLDELKLRNYYLVYAIVFDINDITLNETFNKIKKQIDMHYK